MAKYGEGDKRWIVEERADGTNVHNWHWAERNCLEWSRSFLSSSLAGLAVLSGEGGLRARIVSLASLTGEAYVNIRKGKIIPGYELSLSLSWEAFAEAESAVKVTGNLEIPYLADENADEDPEVKISVRDDPDTTLARAAKDAMIAKGKPLVLEKVRSFVAAMAQGGPAKDELEKKPVPKRSSGTGTAASIGETVQPTVEVKKEEKRKERDGFKMISLTERFYCRALDMYDILMDENRWKGFTQSNARISKDVGGEFSLFDGSISGINEELQPGKLIVQKWRFSSWPEGVFSKVRMVFDEPEQGLVIIKLTQTDVPVEDKYGNSTVVENTERGWRELIFHKIRAVFGFGI